MSPSLALVFCAHHKPWLMMSTLTTLAMQDLRPDGVYVLYHVGDGRCAGKPSYAEYHRLAAVQGGNPQLSPFDERVRAVCRLRGIPVMELEFENDHTLDSGAWYKFFQTGQWTRYDYVVLLGEGTLFTRPNALSSMVRFAEDRGVHMMASGHEKRRLPKSLVMRMNSKAARAGALARFHDGMVARVFDTFCRDPDFKALFEQWSDDAPIETQSHVPDVSAERFPVRLWGPRIHVNGRLVALQDVVEAEEVDGVRFHEAQEPEWFGCATNHLMSREFLQRLTAKLDHHGLYEALDIPFAGSALEIIWGFLPAWLGYRKWFTDGMHRVRKHFVTHRREDDPHGMAAYINRYYRGRVRVTGQGDALKIVAAAKPAAARLRHMLPPSYFTKETG